MNSIVQKSVIIQESGRKSKLYALHYMLVFNNYLSLCLCNTLVWVGSNATFDIYYRTVNVSTSGCLSDSLPFSVSDLSCPRESKRYHAARKLHVTKKQLNGLCRLMARVASLWCFKELSDVTLNLLMNLSCFIQGAHVWRSLARSFWAPCPTQSRCLFLFAGQPTLQQGCLDQEIFAAWPMGPALVL